MFLVDASKEMFIKGEDGEPSNFDMTMQVRWLVIFSFASFNFIVVISLCFISQPCNNDGLCAALVGCAHCVHQ